MQPLPHEKHCPRCDQTKPITDFWRKKKGSKERQVYCKACDNSSSIESRKKNIIDRREKERIVGRTRPKKPRTPEQKERDRERKREEYREHPERSQAVQAVRLGVRRSEKLLRGELTLTERTGPIIFKPDSCKLCNTPHEPSGLQPHHHLGYAREHWLDVIWVCTECHILLGICQRECEAVDEPIEQAFVRFYEKTKMTPGEISREAYNRVGINDLETKTGEINARNAA